MQETKATAEISLEFLFSTVAGRLFVRDSGVLERAHRYLVIDQSDGGGPPRDGRVFVQSGRGLSRSRNAALEHATADWCFVCDDDIDLEPDAPARVRRELQRRPKADVVLFAVRDVDTGEVRGLPPSRWWPPIARVLSVSSIQIAYRRAAVLEAGLRFDERFGLGAVHASGEEAIFLADAVRAGLRLEWSDVPVALHPARSSGSDYADESSALALARAKGAALARIFGAARWPWMLALAWRSRALYSRSMTGAQFLAALDRGARTFETTVSSQSQPRSCVGC